MLGDTSHLERILPPTSVSDLTPQHLSQIDEKACINVVRVVRGALINNNVSLQDRLLCHFQNNTNNVAHDGRVNTFHLSLTPDKYIKLLLSTLEYCRKSFGDDFDEDRWFNLVTKVILKTNQASTAQCAWSWFDLPESDSNESLTIGLARLLDRLSNRTTLHSKLNMAVSKGRHCLKLINLLLLERDGMDEKLIGIAIQALTKCQTLNRDFYRLLVRISSTPMAAGEVALKRRFSELEGERLLESLMELDDLHFVHPELLLTALQSDHGQDLLAKLTRPFIPSQKSIISTPSASNNDEDESVFGEVCMLPTHSTVASYIAWHVLPGLWNSLHLQNNVDLAIGCYVYCREGGLQVNVPLPLTLDILALWQQMPPRHCPDRDALVVAMRLFMHNGQTASIAPSSQAWIDIGVPLAFQDHTRIPLLPTEGLPSDIIKRLIMHALSRDSMIALGFLLKSTAKLCSEDFEGLLQLAFAANDAHSLHKEMQMSGMCIDKLGRERFLSVAPSPTALAMLYYHKSNCDDRNDANHGNNNHHNDTNHGNNNDHNDTNHDNAFDKQSSFKFEDLEALLRKTGELLKNLTQDDCLLNRLVASFILDCWQCFLPSTYNPLLQAALKFVFPRHHSQEKQSFTLKPCKEPDEELEQDCRLRLFARYPIPMVISNQQSIELEAKALCVLAIYMKHGLFPEEDYAELIREDCLKHKSVSIDDLLKQKVYIPHLLMPHKSPIALLQDELTAHSQQIISQTECN